MAITIRKIPCPDVDLEINGVNEGAFAAGSTIELNLTDGVDPVTPVNVTVVDEVVTVEVPVGGGSCDLSTIKSGQATSYNSGDDADIPFGREVNFTTLTNNNPFGNNSRFTDKTGAQTYAVGVVLDWAHRDDVNGLVVGWERGYSPTDIIWTDAFAYANGLTLDSKTDWRVPPDPLLQSLKNTQANRSMDYAPFTNGGNLRFWSSTTPSVLTTHACFLAGQFFAVAGAQMKTTSGSVRVRCYRVYTYAEIGL